MTLADHAYRELDVAMAKGDVEPPIAAALMEVVTAFAGQGHSGSSAAYGAPWTAEVLRRLLAYEPIRPLTGAPEEWVAISAGMVGRPGLEQNVRCGRVFREGTVAYDTNAVVFRTWRHGSIVGWDSARRVTFPYTPTTRRTRWRRASRLVARLQGRLRPS